MSEPHSLIIDISAAYACCTAKLGGKNHFVKHILEIFALIMLTGIFSTLLLPETKGISLEDLSSDETVSPPSIAFSGNVM